MTSIKCARVTYNGTHFEVPEGSECFWIDFNSQSISFDAQIPRENDHDFLEVIYPSVIKFVFVEPYSASQDSKDASK